MTAATRPELIRTIGRWALAGLVINGVIGSAIFGTPSLISASLGRSAPIAWILSAVLIGVVVACFAEVASRFRDAGGPYLYVRATFGRFAGIQTGWMAYLARLTASASVANLFVVYLGEFWLGFGGQAANLLVLTLLLGGLGFVNYRGVGLGSNVSSVFAAAKLIGLGLFVIGGLLWIGGQGAIDAPPTPAGVGPWLDTLLILVFAYGGFEAAMMPLAEAKDPERDAPFALFVALATSALVYSLVQVVVTFTLPDAAGSARPLADAARAFVGPAGAALMALCALLSTFGYLAGGMVNVPRLTFAMAEQGDLPRPFAAVHRAFRTPHVSIISYGVLTWLLAANGSFLKNLTLSVVARLITYGLVCAAVPVLRARDGTPRAAAPAVFRLPGGAVIAGLGVLGMVVVASQISRRETLIMAAVIALASAHYLLAVRTEKVAES
jgi:amino acid transporter